MSTLETKAPARLHEGLEKVKVGSTVEIERDGDTEEWRIAEPDESDVDAGVISSESPLARALLGARQGESRTFWAGRREWTVAVRRVQAPALA